MKITNKWQMEREVTIACSGVMGIALVELLAVTGDSYPDLQTNLAQRHSWARCQAMITLREPNLLKIACFCCKQHIEFPAHAIGQKIPCPPCNMGITLKEPA